MSKAEQPFKRGEWVKYKHGQQLSQVLRANPLSDTDGRVWVSTTEYGALQQFFRRASARELRAESKRLAARAAALSQAADAVSAKKGAGR